MRYSSSRKCFRHNVTLSEIKAACPDIDVIPGAINGFGLLQAMQHTSLTHAALSLNFVHFSVQEYLAAYQVTCLSPQKEGEILEKYFWDSNHLNMFSMYVGITKGQRPCFKNFLSGGSKETKIASKFLQDQLKCLQLFRCFFEADDKSMCASICKADIFSDQKIDLDGNTLLPNDVEGLALFLTTSTNKEWKLLNLSYCQIGDVGCQILYRSLIPNVHSIIIEKIELWDNALTLSSDPFISSIVLSCRTKLLWASFNKVGETEGLYTILTDSSTVLESLYIGAGDLSTANAIILFKALRRNNTLKVLSLRDNSIDDGIADYISTALQDNKSLEELYLRNNIFSEDASQEILCAINYNLTLKLLELPNYSDEIKIKLKQQESYINNDRKSQGCNVEFKITY